MEKKWQWNFTKCLKYIISLKRLYLLKLAALVLFKSTYCFKEKLYDEEFQQFQQIFHMVMFMTIIIVLTVIVIWFCVAVIFLLIRTLITLRTPKLVGTCNFHPKPKQSAKKGLDALNTKLCCFSIPIRFELGGYFCAFYIHFLSLVFSVVLIHESWSECRNVHSITHTHQSSDF